MAKQTCAVVLQDPEGYEWACGRETHDMEEVPHAASIAFESKFGPIFGVLVWVVDPAPPVVEMVSGSFGVKVRADDPRPEPEHEQA